MRPFLFVLMLSLSSLLAGAQSYSKLSIATTGEYYLKFRFNGRQYSAESHSTTFQNLTPGTYPLVIYQWNNTQKQWVDVFNKNVTLTAGKHLDIVIMRFGYNAWNEGTIQTDGWSDTPVNPVPVSNTSPNNNNTQPATEAQFADILKAVQNEWSDADKTATGKAIVKNNWLTAKQIKTLCNTLNSDAFKLDLAKYAYDYCTDKGSYFTLGDMFWSSGYKKSLMDFISSR